MWVHGQARYHTKSRPTKMTPTVVLTTSLNVNEQDRDSAWRESYSYYVFVFWQPSSVKQQLFIITTVSVGADRCRGEDPDRARS